MTVATRPEVGTEPPPARPRRRRWIAAGVIGLLLVGAGAWRLAEREPAADVRAETVAVSADGLAARFGIRVDLIAVTAAGGLVEFRYQVVDPDKAIAMIHDTKMRPVLVVEDTGQTLVLASPHRHSADLQLGGTYYFLIANAHNALQDGTSVTLVIGDARVEHLEVEG
ncbi:hypothetical protein [Cellulomonas sp.]|uniref:hypothetical protein n=1 Tax=Cellulomonas sp. TaxID=40001 RepID=UPI003BA9C0AD